jgi:hypothetical protein
MISPGAPDFRGVNAKYANQATGRAPKKQATMRIRNRDFKDSILWKNFDLPRARYSPLLFFFTGQKSFANPEMRQSSRSAILKTTHAK